MCITGTIRMVANEGMPIYRHPFEKGNLIIKFDITFPPNKFTDEKNLKVYHYIYIYIFNQVSQCYKRTKSYDCLLCLYQIKLGFSVSSNMHAR